MTHVKKCEVRLKIRTTRFFVSTSRLTMVNAHPRVILLKILRNSTRALLFNSRREIIDSLKWNEYAITEEGAVNSHSQSQYKSQRNLT